MSNLRDGVIDFIWPYIWEKRSRWDKSKFIFFIIITVITTLFMSSVPVILKYAILALESGDNFYGLAPITIIMSYGIAWGIAKAASRLRHQSAFPVITVAIQNICTDLFSHLQRLSMDFHGDKKSGEVFNVINRTRYATAFFMQAIGQAMFPTTLRVLFAGIILTWFVGIEYGIIILAMLCAYVVLSLKTADRIVAARKEQNIHDGNANGCIVDSILNAETVKYFNMLDFEIKQARLLLEKKEEADVYSLMSDARVHLIQNIIISISVLILTLLSGIDTINGNISLGDFVMINSFVLMFMEPLSELGYHYREAKLNLAHLCSAFEILRKPIKVKDIQEAQPLEFINGLIEFKGVSFSYNQERKILDNFSFTAFPGTTTAIVGHSGSGKSTISKLLFRLYDIDDGSILIDNQNISRVSRKSICDVIGIVPQDTIMFNDSIKYNICYGGIESSDDEIYNILEQVNLCDLIYNTKDKLDTVVGEYGLKLSGGERQRLAIARMLMRKPKIMLFDEATSALDTITESSIQKCLMRLSKEITTIIIAHRISTIRHADNIIVLEKGKVVEQGTHEDLLRSQGVYSGLLKSDC